jgi:hypothetical protein
MTAEEFLQRARAQETVVVEREISVAGPHALALREGNRRVPLADFLQHPDRKLERRTFRYGHLIEPGVSPADLEDWQERFAGFPLPDDLRRFLLRANGIQLWADLDARHSYFRLLPLDQWSNAASASFAHVFETLPRAALVLSDADDSAGFAVLDTNGPAFLWCDPIAGPEQIGGTVDALLTYWWHHCAPEP